MLHPEQPQIMQWIVNGDWQPSTTLGDNYQAVPVMRDGQPQWHMNADHPEHAGKILALSQALQAAEVIENPFYRHDNLKSDIVCANECDLAALGIDVKERHLSFATGLNTVRTAASRAKAR